MSIFLIKKITHSHEMKYFDVYQNHHKKLINSLLLNKELIWKIYY